MRGTLTRAACARALARRTGLDIHQSDYRRGLRRGRCARKRCESRYATVRVTVDLRDPLRQDYSAVLECVQCGHVWTATKVPSLTLTGTRMPSVLLTIHAPPNESRRAYHTSRGALRIVGSDSRTIRDASYRDLARELEAWKERAERKRRSLGHAQDRTLVAIATDRIARDVEPSPDMRAAMERIAALHAAIAAAQE